MKIKGELMMKAHILILLVLVAPLYAETFYTVRTSIDLESENGKSINISKEDNYIISIIKNEGWQYRVNILDSSGTKVLFKNYKVSKKWFNIGAQPVVSTGGVPLKSEANYLSKNPSNGKQPSREITECIVVVDVNFYSSVTKKIEAGQILINSDLKESIKRVFRQMAKWKFPMKSVFPIAKYGWNDELSMVNNNTSAYNYREVTGGGRLSWHALGRAIDINPQQNPYIKNGKILPKNGAYKPGQPGTLDRNHPVVKLFLREGWSWGGNWRSLKDYQHFEIPGLKQNRKKQGPYCES